MLAGLTSNCGLFLSSTEEVENKGKNSGGLIVCTTSDKLQSPKEAAIDFYLYLSFSNLNVKITFRYRDISSSKCGEERNAGFCAHLDP